ncbi:hypothetical protein OS493_008674 [Desmophyllum pertusum]|uniref:Methyltransferase domain-containing protein n=1 Tax=Desmophyllum pertusum TaxID=174260 RepID=A0A9W9ZRB9_9CNID|nr:hypothetical protein OS493_008674 [Desmophyllum pertusum]
MDCTMISLNEVKQHQPSVDEMRSLAANRPRTNVLGKDFVIYPEVFHPELTLDLTEYVNEEILKVINGELTKKSEETSFDFLEVGCGAGYIAILTALASEKCHVWATDINEAAVKNTIENAKLHGVDARLKAVTADVFDHNILAGKEFDMIYWNMPWVGQNTEPGTEVDVLMRSLLDPGYQSIRRYLLEAKKFLKKTGRIFALFSFNYGSEELFKRVVNETGWKYKIYSTNNFHVGIGDEQQESDMDCTMSSLAEAKQHTPTLDEMRSLAANRPQTSVLGKDFLVYPEVYYPDTSFDITEYMNEEILKVINGELRKKSEEKSFDFLEVGCGAGYTAILTALASEKCHVWATDINETTVKKTIENAKLHGVDARLKAATADVFDHKIFAGK